MKKWWITLGVLVVLVAGAVIGAGSYFYHVAIARGDKSFVTQSTKLSKKSSVYHQSIGIYMRVSKLGLLSHRIIYGWLLGIFQLKILRGLLFWHTDLLGIRV